MVLWEFNDYLPMELLEFELQIEKNIWIKSEHQINETLLPDIVKNMFMEGELFMHCHLHRKPQVIIIFGK